LRHYVDDAQATVAIVGQELYERIAPLGVPHVIVATYSDYLRSRSDLPLPDFVRAPRIATNAVAWRDAVAAGTAPAGHRAGGDDLAVMPYTSGTTGKPKGCMHTHATVQATAIPYLHWRGDEGEAVVLSALPMFHVTGMQAGMNSPIHRGASIVLLSRWDRDCAAMQIERARVTNWSAITTMLVDFVSNPQLPKYDLSSLRQLGVGEVGEIIVHGPQVFKGYWREEQATREAFIEHDGKRFFRTGDLGYYDDEGYFFITDRLKRMINASGFKVWPAEVEAMLYAHP